MKNEFLNGVKDGIGIALGYFAVSFGLGVSMVSGGLSAFQGMIMSLVNVTSAGEFAGLQIIIAGGTLLEMVATQLVINLRYALMSMSLSQKLDEKMPIWQRMVIAFANTDEIFAVAMNHQRSLTIRYMAGLQGLPILGWTAGTFLGAVACGLMPGRVASAMSVMLYGMFIAIVFPVAKKSKPVLLVASLAVALSAMFRYIPAFNRVSAGIAIILCTVTAAGVGAVFFPVEEEESGSDAPERESGKLRSETAGVREMEEEDCLQ